MKAGSILFVDDDEKIIRALKRAMRTAPFVCHFTNSSREAFDLLQAREVNVIVSDLSMPDIGGLELLARVGREYPEIVRIVLSGSSNSQSILSAINQGHIYRYILKPWDDNELKVTISQAYDLYMLQYQKQELLMQLEKANMELEQKVVARTRQLLAETNNAEVGKYASHLVHNLNNALNGVVGNLELIQETLSELEPSIEEIHSYCGQARKGAGFLGEIIASILLHVRQEKESTFQEVDVNQIILSQLHFFNLNPFYKYEIRKEIDLDENLPRIMADAVQVKQILGNLIKNAIDAMESSERKKLVIQTRKSDPEVMIRICDTGSGISEENIPKLFSPDFTTKPVGKGTGLGLSSVKEMVDNHSGYIQVDSELGQGTCITICLQSVDG